MKVLVVFVNTSAMYGLPTFVVFKGLLETKKTVKIHKY